MSSLAFSTVPLVIMLAIGVTQGCHVGSRRSLTFKVQSMTSFFSKCLSDRAGKEFRWQAITRFAVVDTSWYESTSNKYCGGDQDTGRCWQKQIDFLIDPYSRYSSHVKLCIREYASSSGHFNPQFHSDSSALQGESRNLQAPPLSPFGTNSEVTTASSIANIESNLISSSEQQDTATTPSATAYTSITSSLPRPTTSTNFNRTGNETVRAARSGRLKRDIGSPFWLSWLRLEYLNANGLPYVNPTDPVLPYITTRTPPYRPHTATIQKVHSPHHVASPIYPNPTIRRPAPTPYHRQQGAYVQPKFVPPVPMSTTTRPHGGPSYNPGGVPHLTPKFVPPQPVNIHGLPSWAQPFKPSSTYPPHPTVPTTSVNRFSSSVYRNNNVRPAAAQSNTHYNSWKTTSKPASPPLPTAGSPSKANVGSTSVSVSQLSETDRNIIFILQNYQNMPQQGGLPGAASQYTTQNSGDYGNTVNFWDMMKSKSPSPAVVTANAKNPRHPTLSPIVTAAVCDDETRAKFTECVNQQTNEPIFSQRRMLSFNSPKESLTKEDFRSIFTFFRLNFSQCSAQETWDNEANAPTRTCVSRMAARSFSTLSCLPSIMLRVVKNGSALRDIFLSCAS